jgi:hypothetical protein
LHFVQCAFWTGTARKYLEEHSMPQFDFGKFAGGLIALLSLICLPALASAMSIDGTPPSTATVGKSYYWAPTVVGNSASVEFSYVNVPSWSGTYRSSGAIIGTPTAAGVYSNIQIQAWDGTHFAVSAPFTITVTGNGSTKTSTPLKISGTPATTGEVGEFYSFKPTVVAPSGATLSYSIKDKPTWASFSTSSGALSGTPTATGVTSGIVLFVSDASQSVSLPAFSINVAAAPTPPAGEITLSWSPPTENTNGTALTNLAGYVVRYGTNTSALNSSMSLSGAKSTNVELENLSAGTWYFEVAAVNALGIQSAFSVPVSRTVN